MYAALVGEDYINIISDNFVGGMGIDYITFGNVYSFLGSVIAYARPLVGFAVGFALAPLLVMLGYLLFGWAWRTRSGALRAAVLYWSAVFGFGSFEYYFWHLTPYEIMLFGLFFSRLQRDRRRLQHPPGRSSHKGLSVDEDRLRHDQGFPDHAHDPTP